MTDSMHLYIDDRGSSEIPVLFIHSAGGNTQHWEHQLTHVSRTRRAIAIDLRGHGRSPALDGDAVGIDELATGIDGVVSRLELDRFVLVGHSMGAAVSIAYAATQPDRVAGLLLLDPASDGRLVPRDVVTGVMSALRSEAYWPTLEQYWQGLLVNSADAVRDRVLADLRATPPATIIAVLDSLFTYDPITPLAQYRGPRRVVFTGVTDSPAGLHRLVPSLPQIAFEGVGHWLHLDDPAGVNTVLDEFLVTIPGLAD